MTGPGILFLIFALTTCFAAIAVVVSQNVVRMAFWLMVSLGSVAGLFFLLRADFVAATQLLIYVGGTVVLLVFGVMLTASGRFTKIQTTPAESFLGAGIGSLFLAMLFSTVAAVNWPKLSKKTDPNFAARKVGTGYNRATEGNTARPIGMALMGPRTDKDLGKKTDKLSTGYLLPFEIISIHLLVVLIGAAYLARAKRRVDATNSE
jgi:NADH-quinone oxidoreductase subunit J